MREIDLTKGKCHSMLKSPTRKRKLFTAGKSFSEMRSIMLERLLKVKACNCAPPLCIHSWESARGTDLLLYIRPGVWISLKAKVNDYVSPLTVCEFVVHGILYDTLWETTILSWFTKTAILIKPGVRHMHLHCYYNASEWPG